MPFNGSFCMTQSLPFIYQLKCLKDLLPVKKEMFYESQIHENITSHP